MHKPASSSRRLPQDRSNPRVRDGQKPPPAGTQPSVEHLASTPTDLLRPEQVLALQRAVGNGAVQRTLAGSVAASPRETAGSDVIQRKPSPSSGLEHTQAASRHLRDRAALKAAVEAGLTSADRRLKNSCEWIQSGRAHLYALTKTPDSAARAAEAGQPNDAAFFGYGAKNPLGSLRPKTHVYAASAATYNQDDIEKNNEIVFTNPDSGGFRAPVGGKVFVTEPSERSAINAVRALANQGTFDPVEEVLKHEVQHESDRDFDADNSAMGGGAPDTALMLYKTEYRAYSAQGPAWASEAQPSRTHLGKTFDSDRQLAIFKHIHKGYDLVSAAWTARGTLRTGEKFQEAVVNFKGSLDQIAANPNNSVRIAEYYDTLDRIRQYSPLEGKEVADLVTVLAERLDDHDRADLALNRHAQVALADLPPKVKALVGKLLEDPKYDHKAFIDGDEEVKKRKAEADFESTPARIERLTQRVDDALRAKGITTRPKGVQDELDQAIDIIKSIDYLRFPDEEAWNNGLKTEIASIEPEAVKG